MKSGALVSFEMNALKSPINGCFSRSRVAPAKTGIICRFNLFPPKCSGRMSISNDTHFPNDWKSAKMTIKSKNISFLESQEDLT